MDSPTDGWRGAVDRLVAELDKIERHTLEEVLTNLASTADIAREHGFASDSIVYNYRVRYANTPDPFPEPVITFGRIDVYWKPAVEMWLDVHKRRKSSRNKTEGRTH